MQEKPGWHIIAYSNAPDKLSGGAPSATEGGVEMCSATRLD